MPWFNVTAAGALLVNGNICSGQWDYSHGSNWSLPVCVSKDGGFVTERAFVQGCLAQPAGDFDNECTISISLTC